LFYFPVTISIYNKLLVLYYSKKFNIYKYIYCKKVIFFLNYKDINSKGTKW